MLTIVLSALIAFVAGAALGWFVDRSRSQVERAGLEKEARTLLVQWTETRELLDQERERLRKSQEQLAAREASIARLEERAVAAQNAFEQMRATLPDTFKALASQVLEEKSKAFAEQNQENLGHLLEPLKTRLQEFQGKIEASHRDQMAGEASLRTQVDKLVAFTSRVSDEANNLARALKGSSKTQGTWGELVLEKILDQAGLRKGYEYQTQENYAAENGRRAQPDVVIHLPGDRHLVIDSKVSLVQYEAHCSAENDAARAAALESHVGSVRTHMRTLAEKNYQTLYGLNSLDFVIMFLPVEPAFMLALSRDEKLWEQAWQRNVLLVSPSTLLFVVRTVSYLWRQEEQKRNVEEIAKRGAELYNKLVGFVSDLEDVGGRLSQAQKSYDGALNKLSTGRGSVIWQAEKLKALGVKPAKQLPQGMIELAQQEDLDLGEPPDPE
jgi:DNA recombination protein RmuC